MKLKTMLEPWLRLRCLKSGVLRGALGWVCFASPLLLSQTPAEKLLEDGKKFSQQGKVDEAVRLWRSLLRDFPDTPQAPASRTLLAKRGFGLNYRVVLNDRRQLGKVQVTEEKVVRQVDALLDDLVLFFRQTYGRNAPFEFEITVYDSRAKYRDPFPVDTYKRRSSYTPPAGGPVGEKGGKIAVYFDARINPQDILDLMYGSLAREAAVGLLGVYARRPLPETLKVGLAEYLSARLFPDKLQGLAQSQEEILRGVAREGLQRLQKLKDFKEAVLSRSSEESKPPPLLWQWRGFSYSIIDCLLHGEFGEEKKAADPPKGLIPPAPRHAALQKLLRDFEDLHDARPASDPQQMLALFETFLARQFGMDLETFHKGYISHVLKYSPKHPDFEHYSE